MPASSLCRVTLCAAALAFVSPASAQDKAAEGLKVWKDTGCFNCHGTFAEGGEGGHFPAGPSLRRTRLDKDTLRETIACGRPGTQMPYNLAGVYAKVPCYGLPLGQVPPGTTPGSAITPEQLDALVEYLVTRIVGKGNITKAECTAYYGDPNYPDCAGYR